MKDLQAWLERVNTAPTGTEIFQIVDEFRPGEWTDDDRALMARTYIAALSRMAPESLNDVSSEATKEEKVAAKPTVEQQAEQKEEVRETATESEEIIDEEVWYEKM